MNPGRRLSQVYRFASLLCVLSLILSSLQSVVAGGVRAEPPRAEASGLLAGLPSATGTPTPTAGALLSPTSAVTATATPTASVTPTATPSGGATATPTVAETPSSTPTPGVSPTPIEASMATPVVTPSPTSTPTATPTAALAPTMTPAVTPTVTPSPVLTDTLDSADVHPERGGVLRSRDGKVTLYFPPGAVKDRSTARLTPNTGRAPRGPFDWDTYSFDVDVRDQANQHVPSFTRPVTVEVSYTDEEVRGLSQVTLALYSYDEFNKRWVKLPSVVDLPNHKIIATTTHFSDVNYFGQPFLTRPGLLKSFETDLYSGSASYSEQLEVMPGTNGLQPRLMLSYSSGSADEMKSQNSRGSWVGVGWHLNLGSINYDPRRDKFYLSLNGVSDELTLGTDTYYHTNKESFLRIRKQQQSPDDWGHINNVFWEVWTKDGTYYRFGYKPDTNTWDSTGNGDGTQHGVDGSRHFYSNWGSNGSGRWGYVHTYYRWDVDMVLDTHGNSMSVSYRGVSGLFDVDDGTCTNTPNCEPLGNVTDRFDVSAYPYEVKYSFNETRLQTVLLGFANSVAGPSGCFRQLAWQVPSIL